MEQEYIVITDTRQHIKEYICTHISDTLFRIRGKNDQDIIVMDIFFDGNLIQKFKNQQLN